MILTNARVQDKEDIGQLFHAILRYGEAHAERLDQSIVSIGYSTLLSNAELAAHWLGVHHKDTGDDWDGCVWIELLEDISEGSLAHLLYADDVDVESVVLRWLAPLADQALKLEQALALGFNSIDECDEHQKWLDRQAEQNDRIRTAVKAGDESGSQIIDLRFLSAE